MAQIDYFFQTTKSVIVAVITRGAGAALLALAAPAWAGEIWPVNAGAVDLLWIGLLFGACMLGAGGILFMPRRRMPAATLPLQPPPRRAAPAPSVRPDLRDGIADLVHEIRAPLSVISGEIEAAQCGIRAIDAQTLEALAAESARLARLLRDLEQLTVNHAEAAMTQYQFAPLLLDGWLQRWLRQRSVQLAQAGIALRLEVDGAHAMPVQADAQRLTQLFENLLQNTLRYTTAPGTLHVALQRSAHGAPCITWQDSAPGVPLQQLAALRERHWRGDHTVAGSGLGLDIASRIAHAHHARFEPAPSRLGGLCWTLEFMPPHGERA